MRAGKPDLSGKGEEEGSGAEGGREGGRELRAGGGGAGVRDARRLFIRATIGRGGR